MTRCDIKSDRPKLSLHRCLANSPGDESARGDLVMLSLMPVVMETLSPLDASWVSQLRPDRLFSPRVRRRWLTAHPRHIEPYWRRLRAPKGPYSIVYSLVRTYRQTSALVKLRNKGVFGEVFLAGLKIFHIAIGEMK